MFIANGRGLRLWLFVRSARVYLGPPGFTCWISLSLVFSLIYCLVLILALSPFYILIYIYVLRDDALVI